MKAHDYALLILFIIILILSFLLVRPFISTLISSIILAYIFFPLYKKIKNLIGNESVSAVIVIIFIIAIIIIPLFFIANVLVKESVLLYKSGQVQTIIDSFNNILGNPELSLYLDEAINVSATYLKNLTSAFIIKIPIVLLNLFVLAFITFFLLKDGEMITKRLENLPIKTLHREELIEQFESLTQSTVYGWFLGAMVQGILGFVGLFIFGISNPVFWGVVMTILALLPTGSVVIWLPASLWLISTGDLFNGIGLLIYGVLIVSLADNVFKIWFIKKRSKINPVISLLGLLGGLALFGFIGIVIGPLILAYFFTFLKIYGVSHKHAT